MTYIINRYSSDNFDSNWPLQLTNDTIDSFSTSLKLHGKGVIDYGQSFATNWVHLLENFAGTLPPTNPITGQLWFDTIDSAPGTGQLKVYNGVKWRPVGSTNFGPIGSIPVNSNNKQGDLYFAIDNNQKKLYIFDGGNWTPLTGASVLPAPPPTPKIGDFWIDTNTNPPSIKFFDGNKWIGIINSGDAPPNRYVNGINPPANPSSGDLWFSQTDNKLFIYSSNVWNATDNSLGKLDLVNGGIVSGATSFTNTLITQAGTLPNNYGTLNQALLTDGNGIISYGNVVNSLNVGAGLSGTITNTGTISLDIAGQTTAIPTNTDEMIFWNGTAFRKNNIATIMSSISLPINGGSLTGNLDLIDGTVASPSLQFQSSTGFYSPNVGEIGITLNGTEKVRFNAFGTGINCIPSSNFQVESNTDAATSKFNNNVLLDGSGTAYTIEANNSGYNSNVINAKNNNLSYVKSVYYAETSKTAGTTFSFFKAASDNGIDVKHNLRGDGNAYCDLAFVGGGADYCELFEWEDGNPNNEDRRGMTVTLIDDKIRIAEKKDKVIGVISANPSVIGNAAALNWANKYLTDQFGNKIIEEIEIWSWSERVKDENGETKIIIHECYSNNIPKGIKPPKTRMIQKIKCEVLNPEYDPSKEYIPREDRKEWGMVGLVGRLRILKGQLVDKNWIKMKDINENVSEWLVK